MFPFSLLFALIVLQLTKSESSCQHESTPLKSLCSGCPPTYNGTLCASTTRYTDLTRGSCGCGTDPNPPDFWTKVDFTAALNCVSLDPQDPQQSWCPTNCGLCFRLCATGGTTNGKVPNNPGHCEVFQVTNRCGDGYENPSEAQWCRQQMSFWDCSSNPNKCYQFNMTNNYGYSAHFDLQDVNGQIDNLGWDNIEVTFAQVNCSQGNFGNWQATCACPEAQ